MPTWRQGRFGETRLRISAPRLTPPYECFLPSRQAAGGSLFLGVSLRVLGLTDSTAVVANRTFGARGYFQEKWRCLKIFFQRLKIFFQALKKFFQALEKFFQALENLLKIMAARRRAFYVHRRASYVHRHAFYIHRHAFYVPLHASYVHRRALKVLWRGMQVCRRCLKNPFYTASFIGGAARSGAPACYYPIDASE